MGSYMPAWPRLVGTNLYLMLGLGSQGGGGSEQHEWDKLPTFTSRNGLRNGLFGTAHRANAGPSALSTFQTTRHSTLQAGVEGFSNPATASAAQLYERTLRLIVEEGISERTCRD